MKKAKKIFNLLVISSALVIGTTEAVFSIVGMNISSTPEEIKEPIRLTHSSEYKEGEFVSTNQLKTEQGIVITCSDNYVMGEAINNNNDELFWYSLSNAEYEAENYLKDDYDWKVTFSSSNSKLIKIEYYYFNYDEFGIERISYAIKIGSEPISDNQIIVDRYYKEKFIDQIKLYFEGEDKQIYYAIFEVTGK